MKPSNIYEAMAMAQNTVLALVEAGCEVLSVSVDCVSRGFTPRLLVLRNNELDQLVMDKHAVVTESPVGVCKVRMARIDMRGCCVSWAV